MSVLEIVSKLVKDTNQIKVQTLPERLDVKKTGFARKKPIRIWYSVYIDDTKVQEFHRDYEPWGLDGAVEAMKKLLLEGWANTIKWNRAIRDFNALAVEEEVTV